MKTLCLILFMPLHLSFSNVKDNSNEIRVITDRITIKFDNLLEFYQDTNYTLSDYYFLCYSGLCYLNNDNAYLNMCFDFGPKEKTFKESLGPILKRGHTLPNDKIIYPPVYKEIGGKGFFLQESILNNNNESYHVFSSYIDIDSMVTFKIKLSYKGNRENIRKKIYKMLISFRIIKYNKNGNSGYYCG